MNPIGSSTSTVAQIYSGIQSRNGNAVRNQQSQQSEAREAEFKMPVNATPRGDWVLSENANPQNFEADAQRGSYLNIVV